MNGIATTTDDDQCIQFYYHHQQPFMDISMEGFSHATMVTTSPTMSSNDILSPNGHLTPKNNTFKPIRKRSRASKKTPTTLLIANSTNFRALVQQFTGCPTIKSAISFATHKGPITLNFQQAHQVPVPQPQQLIPKQEQHQSQSNFLPTGLEVSDYGLPMNNDLSNVLYM